MHLKLSLKKTYDYSLYLSHVLSWFKVTVTTQKETRGSKSNVYRCCGYQCLGSHSTNAQRSRMTGKGDCCVYSVPTPWSLPQLTPQVQSRPQEQPERLSRRMTGSPVQCTLGARFPRSCGFHCQRKLMAEMMLVDRNDNRPRIFWVDLWPSSISIDLLQYPNGLHRSGHRAGAA